MIELGKTTIVIGSKYSTPEVQVSLNFYGDVKARCKVIRLHYTLLRFHASASDGAIFMQEKRYWEFQYD